MSDKSTIEWTDATFNIVHGCTKVSEACQHCYAELWDKRTLYDDVTHWGQNATRLRMSDSYWAKPLRWNSAAKKKGIQRKVFCSSMADVFEDHPTLALERPRLWELIEATPNLTWQLLTKRPQNIMSMIPTKWATNGLPQNVWAMASTENQQRFDERVGHLLKVPATVLGFSCEPLLSAINFGDRFDSIDASRLWVIAAWREFQCP